ncbi:MAG: hypothetical protein WC196_05965 [Bacilli bacterium]|jgi:hypothetical protein
MRSLITGIVNKVEPVGMKDPKLIQIEFKGNTIGIFPAYWRTPEPSENELEAYLWGRSNGRLQMRTSRGGGWR